MTILTAREFNQDVSAAKRAAATEPVIVTDRGRATHVLLDISQYEKLTGQGRGLVEALRMDDDEDIDFAPVRFEAQVPNL